MLSGLQAALSAFVSAASDGGSYNVCAPQRALACSRTLSESPAHPAEVILSAWLLASLAVAASK